MEVKGRVMNEPAFFKIDQQRMRVSMHPQSSTVTIGLQNPHAKVSTTFVFSLAAVFFAVPVFALYFLVFAIFQSAFPHLL